MKRIKTKEGRRRRERSKQPTSVLCKRDEDDGVGSDIHARSSNIIRKRRKGRVVGRGNEERMGREWWGEEAYLFFLFINGGGGECNDAKELLAEQGSGNLVGELGVVVAREVQVIDGSRHSRQYAVPIHLNQYDATVIPSFWCGGGREGYHYHDNNKIICDFGGRPVLDVHFGPS